MFYCNEWLTSAQHDIMIEMELNKTHCEQIPSHCVKSTSWNFLPGKLSQECPQPLVTTSMRYPTSSRQQAWNGPGYNITFWASNIWLGGTGDSIQFEIVGDLGSSRILRTACRNGSAMPQNGRGLATMFSFPQVPYLGHLSELHVGMDGGDRTSRWHLRIIEVEHIYTGSSWRFPCHAWIDGKSEGSCVLYADSQIYATRTGL